MSAWTYRSSDPIDCSASSGRAPGADSEEKHEPMSDIDTVVVDSLKALDPKRPIREADMSVSCGHFAIVPESDIHPIHKVNQGTGYGCSGTREWTLMAAPPFSPG